MEGGCACGHVRYRLNGKPMIVHACHCTWCQRETRLGACAQCDVRGGAGRAHRGRARNRRDALGQRQGPAHRPLPASARSRSGATMRAGSGGALRARRHHGRSVGQCPPDVHIVHLDQAALGDAAAGRKSVCRVLQAPTRYGRTRPRNAAASCGSGRRNSASAFQAIHRRHGTGSRSRLLRAARHQADACRRPAGSQ